MLNKIFKILINKYLIFILFLFTVTIFAEDSIAIITKANGEVKYKKYSEEFGETYDDDLVRESIELTHHIAQERIDKFYPDNTVRLPSFVIPEGMSENDALSAMSLNGLQSKKNNNVEYINRLNHELQVIKDRGFSRYFLTMKAIADKATSMQFTGPSRGSAGGSLVAYVLGITQVDPIRHGLLFSRFLRSDATDYPDIDYDVSDPMTLKESLVKEWGEKESPDPTPNPLHDVIVDNFENILNYI